MLVDLSKSPSIVTQFVAELRDVKVQNDRLRFQRNLERIGSIAAVEISRSFSYKKTEVATPLAKAEAVLLEAQPVVATILRAGVPLQTGILNIFDSADAAFVSAYRKHAPDHSFKIELEYLSCPALNDRILILCDPMLATGASAVVALKELSALGAPKHTHFVCAIAAIAGVESLMEAFPDITIWAGTVDPELNDKAYIVPGLGDAGDLAYGSKLQR